MAPCGRPVDSERPREHGELQRVRELLGGRHLLRRDAREAELVAPLQPPPSRRAVRALPVEFGERVWRITPRPPRERPPHSLSSTRPLRGRRRADAARRRRGGRRPLQGPLSRRRSQHRGVNAGDNNSLPRPPVSTAPSHAPLNEGGLAVLRNLANPRQPAVRVFRSIVALCVDSDGVADLPGRRRRHYRRHARLRGTDLLNPKPKFSSRRSS